MNCLRNDNEQQQSPKYRKKSLELINHCKFSTASHTTSPSIQSALQKNLWLKEHKQSIISIQNDSPKWSSDNGNDYLNNQKLTASVSLLNLTFRKKFSRFL